MERGPPTATESGVAAEARAAAQMPELRRSSGRRQRLRPWARDRGDYYSLQWKPRRRGAVGFRVFGE